MELFSTKQVLTIGPLYFAIIAFIFLIAFYVHMVKEWQVSQIVRQMNTNKFEQRILW